MKVISETSDSEEPMENPIYEQELRLTQGLDGIDLVRIMEDVAARRPSDLSGPAVYLTHSMRNGHHAITVHVRVGGDKHFVLLPVSGDPRIFENQTYVSLRLVSYAAGNLVHHASVNGRFIADCGQAVVEFLKSYIKGLQVVR